MQQVRSGVVGCGSHTLFLVHHSFEHGVKIYPFRQFFDYMKGQIVFLYRVEYLGTSASFVHQITRIANLAAAFGIKRSHGKYQLIEHALFVLHTAVLRYLHIALQSIVTDKTAAALGREHNPVVYFGNSRLACALLLFGHLFFKAFLVYPEALFPHKKGRQVQRETVCVV